MIGKGTGTKSLEIGKGRMLKLAPKYAPLVYGIIQAAITSAVATGIANYQLVGFEMEFLQKWARSWSISWLTMLPIVVLVAPFIHRAVIGLTTSDRSN